MRWSERVAHTEARKCAYRFVVGKREGMKPLGNPGVDERMILKWIFKKWNRVWTGLLWLRIRIVGELLWIV
jgi:hypothetical protein